VAIPSTPVNFYLQAGNGQTYLSWAISSGATSYQVQRSTDGVNFTTIASPATNYFTDIGVLVSVLYYYQVAATNVSGTSPYTANQSIVPTAPGLVSLGELRLEAQERADMVNSPFLTLPEWNLNISKSYKWLYNLLIQKYGEDYYYSVPYTFQTTGQLDPLYQTQVFPLPNGNTVTDYASNIGFTGTTNGTATISAVSSVAGLLVGQAVSGLGIPAATVILAVGTTTITLSQAATASAAGVALIAGKIIPAFYKEMLVEVALNYADPNSWVTLKKYQRIQQNLWNYPNVYTFYGITNLRYRITGNYMQIVPIASAGQFIRCWYAPRPNVLMADTDTIDGVSGYEEMIAIHAAIKALTKEESDCQELKAELEEKISEIEEASANRDVGEPDTISDGKMRNFAWHDDGTSSGGGMT
jgi:hypothetical protein